MQVTFVDTLTVSEYFELGALRPDRALTRAAGRGSSPRPTPPSVAGYTAHLDDLVAPARHPRRRQQRARSVSLQRSPDGMPVRLPPARQRRLLGRHPGHRLLPRRRPGQRPDRRPALVVPRRLGTDTWRIRPTAREPGDLHRRQPAAGDAAGGRRRHQGRRHEPAQLLHHHRHDRRAPAPGPAAQAAPWTAAAPTASPSSNRQRERASIVICTLNADVYGFAELENTTPSATITDLLGAVNARCGGAHPYAFVNTGGTLGTDAIRVQQIYRTGILSPVGVAALRPRPDPQPAADRADLRRRRRRRTRPSASASR